MLGLLIRHPFKGGATIEYNKLEEEAWVNEMILERAGSAAEEILYTMEDVSEKGYQAIENGVVGGYKEVEN